ncbi:uncharacterized protein EI97DRAFT_282673 [Westerdykella ornata]|uniref:Uncharacterized protein n=1 Tax=Westerdykella ornata TaxID=318751 RepID=A0A6A6JNI1_WESOR|nr:uncharacterized protein EI97DRAFT_282673 [Westerdykella ornata]KAF2278072.1 hypothetical protein EI97DRAFT_282673 [Westerdykella ornata]
MQYTLRDAFKANGGVYHTLRLRLFSREWKPAVWFWFTPLSQSGLDFNSHVAGDESHVGLRYHPEARLEFPSDWTSRFTPSFTAIRTFVSSSDENVHLAIALNWRTGNNIAYRLQRCLRLWVFDCLQIGSTAGDQFKRGQQSVCMAGDYGAGEYTPRFGSYERQIALGVRTPLCYSVTAVVDQQLSTP